MICADGHAGRPLSVAAPYVGREEELQLLENAYARAVRDRRAQLVTIYGEPGIGKSRLAREFFAGLERTTVLTGRSLPFGEGLAYRPLAEMGPEEKTTPAGRFAAHYGPAIGGEPVLWVDYPNSVALHPVVTGNRRERRLQRLSSPTPDDNRITHGCINVSREFFERVVSPAFEDGGVFYILPDAAPLAETFPGFAHRDGAPQRNGGRRARSAAPQ